MSALPTAPLAEICDFQSGLWTGKKPPFTKATVVRNTNFRKNGLLDLSDVAVLDVEVRHLAKRLLQHNDIILEKSGGGPKQAVGRVALFRRTDGEPYSFSNFTSSLRVNDARRLDACYLHYFLGWQHESGVTATMQSNSTGIRNLDLDRYKQLRLPLPPLPEQQRIVAILDEAFEGMATATANAEANILDARMVFSQALAIVFEQGGEGWIKEPIHPTVQFIDYRGRTPPKVERGIRLITAKNVKPGYVTKAPEEFMDASVYETWMTRGIPERGDVLFTTEAPLGNVAQLETDERVVVGQRLITLKPDQRKLDRTYLKYMLMSDPLQRSIRKQATGATVQGIKASLLKQIEIFYPRDLHQQHGIVTRLDRLSEEREALVANKRAKLTALTVLKQSLLHQAFSGQL